MFLKSGGIISVCFVVYLWLIWGDYLSFYWVTPPAPVELEKIQGLKTEPADSILEGMLQIDDPAIKFEEKINSTFTLSLNTSLNDKVSHEKLVPFATNHPVLGTSSTKLAINSLGVTNILIEQYVAENDASLLVLGLEYTLSYAQWDMDNSLKAAFNNNDHAVASWAMIVTKLWRHYRIAGTFQNEKARRLLDYAGYLGAKLLNESFYTYHSNHGTMQNLALMILGASFKSLPEASRWFTTGLNRLEEQIGYLLSDDGFFLEHSFGYHVFFTGHVRHCKVHS